MKVTDSEVRHAMNYYRTLAKQAKANGQADRAEQWAWRAASYARELDERAIFRQGYAERVEA